jgi:hypothetical protein
MDVSGSEFYEMDVIIIIIIIFIIILLFRH